MSILRYINHNGNITDAQAASLQADNRAFRYGYGLFETMLFADDEIRLKDHHWERLFSGLQTLGFGIPKLFTPAYLEEEVRKTVKRNQAQAMCRVRLQIYAGNGGIYDDALPKPGFLVECYALDAQITTLNENGLQTGIANGLQKSTDSLANLKSANALIYAMAAQQAKANKWNDSLVLNTRNNIIESTIANIFWVKDDVIHTPPLSEGCIAGVMRRHILSRLQSAGIHTKEAALTIDTLRSADTVFLTNAIRQIKWVAAVDGHPFSNKHVANIYNTVFQKT